jgi:hypothetical protein
MWVANEARLLSVRALTPDEPIPDALERALSRSAIPGTASVLACDAWRLLVLLRDGSAWRFDWRGWRPRWVDQVREDQMHAITVAGSGCDGQLWVCDPERRLWRWATDGRSPIGARVPGTEPVVAVDIESATVMLGDGSVFSWLCGRWVPMPAVTHTGATVRIRVIGTVGICCTKGDVFPGAELELPEPEARDFINRGVAEPVVEAP